MLMAGMQKGKEEAAQRPAKQVQRTDPVAARPAAGQRDRHPRRAGRAATVS